jgi:hypothetical protein
LILSGLLPDVLGRIEENLPSVPLFPGPTFWNLTGEVYQHMVDAMFEAALVTGVVQVGNVSVILAPNVTYYSLQTNLGGGGYGEGGYGQGGYGGGAVVGIPAGVIACLRMKAPWSIRKTTLNGLDNAIPAWQQAAPGTQIQAWFPLGVSYFGIYPQLVQQATVTMDFLISPVNEARPYTGNETVPFQAEFTDLVPEYAAALLRTKEGGAEAEEAETTYQAYLTTAKALSAFQTRLDSLVYSKAFGGQTQVNPRAVV